MYICSTTAYIANLLSLENTIVPQSDISLVCDDTNAEQYFINYIIYMIFLQLMLMKPDITYRKRTNKIEILLNEKFAAEECSLAKHHMRTMGIVLSIVT